MSLKQLAFVSAYVGAAKGNATEAARLAGYKGTDAVLRSVGSENLTKPDIAREIEAYRERVKAEGIANQQNRIDEYNRRWDALRQIVSERGDDMAGVPGGSTGWLARTHKTVGSGDYSRVVEEYAFDTGLHKEVRELEKQAALELGQIVEKQEHTGKDGGPIAITGIDVPLPVRDDEGDDDDGIR